VPREEFVPQDSRAASYEDGPLPIGYDQTISQPYIVAFMTEKLQPKPNNRVLEVEKCRSDTATAWIQKRARESGRRLQRLAGARALRCNHGDVCSGSRAAPAHRAIERGRSHDYSGGRFRQSGTFSSGKKERPVAAAGGVTGSLRANGGRRR